MTTTESNTFLPETCPQLERLLQLMGIAANYIDYAGNVLEISLADRVRILALMGCPLNQHEDIEEALHDYYESTRGDWLAPAYVLAANMENDIDIYLPPNRLAHRFSWTLNCENGDCQQGEFQGCDLPETEAADAASETLSRRRFTLSALPAGYHRLEFSDGDKSSTGSLIVTPARCYEPDWFVQRRRLAGMSLQLYSLRSQRNWGIGDFTDLQAFLREAGEASLDFVVLNPLHILDGAHPESCSPYSPLDRRFLNPLYLDLEQEPDFIESQKIHQYVQKPAFQEKLEACRAVDLVDYTTVSHLKMAVLSKMFKHFRKHHLSAPSERGQEFLNWTDAKGAALAEFADFQALRFQYSVQQIRDPQFHSYLQWLTECQLEFCQRLTRELGMAVGLVRDLAVGGNATSSEVQLNPGLFSTGASIGAPTDPLAPQGQNWGLPPVNPHMLKATAYRHFIELLRDNMGHCGALRIDHIMALMRLWWCPGQSHNGEGAYVYYPANELFAILRLESLRQKCAIIGEDLGVVPPEIRRLMNESGILSNVLFYFEKYDPIHFKKPQHFPEQALAMVANHDVPTLTAWWNRTDLQLRQQIGLYKDQEDYDNTLRARESDLIQILHWLNELGLLPDHWQGSWNAS